MLRKSITILAALLVLMSAAAFAQVTVSGTVEYDLNTTMTFVKDQDTDASAESDLLDNSNVVVGFAKDAISGNVIIRTAGAVGAGTGLSGLFDFRANWKINDLLTLNASYSWLPGAFFSRLGIDGDSNALLGASAIGRKAYLRLNIDGAYAGFWADGAKEPGFFVGYDYTTQGFSAGINGIGNYDTTAEVFSLVGSLHGTATFGPASIRANLALYSEGSSISGALTAFGDTGEMTGKPYLEALVDFGFTQGSVTAIVTAAFGQNLDTGANVLQAGLAVPIQMVAGFRLIPGLIFKSTLSDGTTTDTAVNTVKLGVSLVYSF